MTFYDLTEITAYMKRQIIINNLVVMMYEATEEGE